MTNIPVCTDINDISDFDRGWQDVLYGFNPEEEALVHADTINPRVLAVFSENPPPVGLGHPDHEYEFFRDMTQMQGTETACRFGGPNGPIVRRQSPYIDQCVSSNYPAEVRVNHRTPASDDYVRYFVQDPSVEREMGQLNDGELFCRHVPEDEDARALVDADDQVIVEGPIDRTNSEHIDLLLLQVNTRLRELQGMSFEDLTAYNEAHSEDPITIEAWRAAQGVDPLVIEALDQDLADADKRNWIDRFFDRNPTLAYTLSTIAGLIGLVGVVFAFSAGGPVFHPVGEDLGKLLRPFYEKIKDAIKNKWKGPDDRDPPPTGGERRPVPVPVRPAPEPAPDRSPRVMVEPIAGPQPVTQPVVEPIRTPVVDLMPTTSLWDDVVYVVSEYGDDALAAGILVGCVVFSVAVLVDPVPGDEVALGATVPAMAAAALTLGIVLPSWMTGEEEAPGAT